MTRKPVYSKAIDVDRPVATDATSALYTYDAVSRLRAECYPVTGAVCVAKSPRNVYTYDLVGNRTSETSRTVVGTKATTVVTDYTYDAAYQLLTKSVDGTATVTNTWSPNGALATSTTPTGTQTYTTDLTDELISLTLEDGSTVGYTQDASGNRTSRTVDGLLDATWAWDDLSSLPMRIGEYDPTGALTTGWLPDPTSSTGASLAQTSNGSSAWLLSDPFANTVATVSTTGNTLSGTRTMDAFGVERTTATGSLGDASVGFAGQYLDAATGLYDMRARDYDPSSGRFTATDPVNVPTGMPYVAGYSYSYNNPLMFSDPSGQWSVWDDLYNGTAVIVNGVASLGNAALQNPGADAAIFGGLLLMNVGAAMEPPGIMLDATGVGAIAGVPINLAGAVLVVGGGVLTTWGGLTLVQHATADCSVTVMHMRSPESSSGGGKTEPPSQKGTTFRGGSKAQRDNWYGINDSEFQKWWHREGKADYGGADIDNAAEAQEIYQDWIDMGKPGAK